MANQKSISLGLGGAIIGITGGLLCYAGKQMDNDLKKQLSSIWNTGGKDGTGEALFYIGMGLIVIGLIMIVINIVQYYQPDRGSSENNSKTDEHPYTFVCSKCKTKVKENMQVCPNCGKELNWGGVENNKFAKAKTVSAEPNQTQQSDSSCLENTVPKQFCTNCGAKLIEGDKFCGSCGARAN